MTRVLLASQTEKIIMEYSNLIVTTIIVITAMAAVMSAGMIIAASCATATATFEIKSVIPEASRRHNPMSTHSGKISWLG